MTPPQTTLIYPRAIRGKNQPWSRLRVSLLPICLLFSIGCATTKTMPTHPSRAAEKSEETSGVRFEAEEIRFREPVIPVSGGNLWRREVGNFTAEQLNTLLNTKPTGTLLRTTVIFEMHPASSLQIGSWKEMTVGLITYFPDGRVVESEAISAYIDNNFEFAIQQGFIFGGPVLEIASFIGAIYILTQPVLFNVFTCGCILAVGLSGVALNVAQGASQLVVAANEERRWSDLYMEALEQHAQDIRKELKNPSQPVYVPGLLESSPGSATPAPKATPKTTTKQQESQPLPLMVDPADSSLLEKPPNKPETVPAVRSPERSKEPIKSEGLQESQPSESDHQDPVPSPTDDPKESQEKPDEQAKPGAAAPQDAQEKTASDPAE
jgi:hypothetical protein